MHELPLPALTSYRLSHVIHKHGLTLLGHPVDPDAGDSIIASARLPMGTYYTIDLIQFKRAVLDGIACGCEGCLACGILALKRAHHVFIKP